MKNSWIRTVYLYLFSLLGLVLIVIGTVRLLDLGLKIVIFRQADQVENYRSMPPYPVREVLDESGETVKTNLEDIKLTDKEIDALASWQLDYQNWKESQEKVDYRRSQRERAASNSLAFILVGVPVYLYHWRIIKRDRSAENV